MYRAPYYPQTQVEESVTRFGTIATNCKNLYETPIKGKTNYRVDLLEALVDMWGSNVLMSRDLTYCLVSGSCTDDKYRSVIKSYYRKFIAFGNYINHIFIFLIFLYYFIHICSPFLNKKEKPILYKFLRIMYILFYL